MLELYIWLSIVIGLSVGAINLKRDCQIRPADVGEMFVSLVVSVIIAFAVAVMWLPVLVFILLVGWLMTHHTSSHSLYNLQGGKWL